jgi:hypothetical protein
MRPLLVMGGIGRETAGQFGPRYQLPRKSQIRDMGHTALPLRRKACCGLFRPKNPTASAGVFLPHCPGIGLLIVVCVVCIV